MHLTTAQRKILDRKRRNYRRRAARIWDALRPAERRALLSVPPGDGPHDATGRSLAIDRRLVKAELALLESGGQILLTILGRTVARAGAD